MGMPGALELLIIGLILLFVVGVPLAAIVLVVVLMTRKKK